MMRLLVLAITQNPKVVENSLKFPYDSIVASILHFEKRSCKTLLSLNLVFND